MVYQLLQQVDISVDSELNSFSYSVTRFFMREDVFVHYKKMSQTLFRFNIYLFSCSYTRLVNSISVILALLCIQSSDAILCWYVNQLR